MKSLDLRTQAWLDDMFLYCGANVYGPDKLKEELGWSREWSERVRRNFDYVLENRSLTAGDYARRTDIEFENDEALFAYLQTLRDFLYAEGPYPEFEGRSELANVRSQAYSLRHLPLETVSPCSASVGSFRCF